MISVYTASVMRHAKKWRDHNEAVYQECMREDDERKVFWTSVSSWPKLCESIPETCEPSVFSACWEIDILEVKAARVTMVYAEPDDKLRGALVEAGAALAFGKTVACVGQNPGFGSWQNHPLCRHFNDLDQFNLWCKLSIHQMFR